MNTAIFKNGSGSLQRENSDRALYRNVADALASAQIGMQAGKESLALLGNGHARACDALESQINYVSALRFSLREKFAEDFSEREAADIFELPPNSTGGRHETIF